jgi:hypothetical protein
MFRVLPLSRDPLIPDNHIIDLALGSDILAVNVCKDYICVPIVQRCQICLKVEVEGQGILVVVAVVQERVEVSHLERLLYLWLPKMFSTPGVRREEVKRGENC